MTPAEALRGVSRIGIDASAFIDFAQAAPRGIRALTYVFGQIDAGALAGVTTLLTIAEVFAYAREEAADLQARERQYRALLFGQGIERVPVSEEIAFRAAALRSVYRLATVDAVQAATALEVGCQAFLTSDAHDFLRLSGEIRVIVPAKLTV